VVTDYTPESKSYKKTVDIKEIEEANPSLVKFNNQYYEVPQKAQINYYPYGQHINKLHPFYDYEAHMKTKGSL
jgi:hypothetical protein